MGYVDRPGDDDETFLQDVTGDGFPDLILKSSGGLRIYVNDGGQRYDDVIAIEPSDLPPGWKHEDSRLLFGDMNGSGSTDLVILQGNVAWYVDPLGGQANGVLVTADNGRGGKTTVEYTSTTELSRSARIAGKPWASETPYVVQVATKVETWNGLGGTFDHRNITRYSYREPVYDGRDRLFRGFRQSQIENVGDADAPTSFTRTSYFVGRCEDDAPSASCRVEFAYNAEGQRVIKTSGSSSDPQYTLDIFASLKLDKTHWLGASGTEPARYEHTAETESVYLTSGATPLARVTRSAPTVPGGARTRVYLILRDSLGSSSILIDKETSELVESVTYLPFGGTESDFRPARWGHERESKRFTGKEDDLELGLVYFGARYYSPHLGRFISPDPAAVHELKADPNVYAYVSGKVFAAIDPKGLDAIPSTSFNGDPSDPNYWATLSAYNHMIGPVGSLTTPRSVEITSSAPDVANNVDPTKHLHPSVSARFRGKRCRRVRNIAW